MDLPAPVSAALVRGIAAYLRDAPPKEIPAGLRRFGGFRDQALKPHRDKLLAALEDEDFRNHLLDWLKESPPLNKKDLGFLSTAAAREDGWEQKLSGAAPPKKDPVKSETQRLKDELARERSKVQKLKEDIRIQREAAREEVRREKARASELSSEVKDLRVRLRDIEVEARSAQAEVAKLERASEKEKRSLRRDAERASAARAKADERMGSLKRETAALKRRVQSLEHELETERTKAARSRRPRARDVGGTQQRRPLSVPKGRLEDAPETLHAWLGTPGVRLVVDGYNVGKATDGFPEMDLEPMRKRVVDEIAKLARRHSIGAVVVFDGADVAPGTARRRQGSVKIEYSRPGEIADDHIVALVEDLPPDPVVVVTNDRELQGRVQAHSATVATSTQLLALVRSKVSKP